MNSIQYIDPAKLKSYRDHIFPLYSGDRLDRLVESIKTLGVLTPIIVRALDFKGNSYEILAGHNRVHACRIAGIQEVPAIAVIPKSEEEAKLIAIETNMCQRSLEEIPVSVKARAIAQWYSCIKAQGMRTDLLDEIAQLERIEQLDYSIPEDTKNFTENNAAKPDETEENLTSVQIEQKSEAREYISEKTGISAAEIQRLIRISKLSDQLLEKVDNGTIPYTAAYELSFVPADTLFALNIIYDSHKTLSITIKAAQRLRYATKNGKNITNGNEILKIISGDEKLKKEKPMSVTLKPKLLTKYFGDIKSKKSVTEKVEKSLELTEVVIPQILQKHNVSAVADYDSIVTEALNMYFQSKK
ncbi:ParB N-terminal domain-containing protein [Ruminococcus sp. Marseille-P6503]|uniref:ParB N-terminal domain-containing protein n=1 Tax=Ruminococcus sp. Marseille-P6503 TaxID=2364796 RepID=UPI000F51EF02|nr:ParB N-terminal domain-containing protein [Ruminococcus sp. Marseille-P6503]